MRIIDYGAASLASPGRGKMQDTYAIAQRGDGTYFFGVFDGHGRDGMEVAEAASNVMLQGAAEAFEPRTGAQARGVRMASLLKKLHSDFLKDCHTLPTGGTTATVAIVTHNVLSVNYLGDSEAVYFPNEYREMVPLIKPHNVHNSDEVRRVTDAGHAIEGNYFYGTDGRGGLAISRAVGDWHKGGYLSQDAESSVLNLDQQYPGTLVIASDGIWGNGLHDEVQSFVNMGFSAHELAKGLVEEFGPKTRDDATAIIVRFQSDHYEEDQILSEQTLA